MHNEKILVIEDDNDINALLCEALSKAGYSCVSAFSGTEGLLVFGAGGISLVLLDLMLPGKTGEAVLSEIRAKSVVPVIVMSARDSVDTKIDLLSSGADDYITKPFNIKELLARVSVQLRRSAPAAEMEKLAYGDILLDKTGLTLTLKNVPVELTKQELKIMELFLSHPDRAFTKQDIYSYAWDDYYIGEDKTINVHISNIRRKFKAISEEEYIETVWGVGFRLRKL